MKLHDKLFNKYESGVDIRFDGKYPLHMPGHKRRMKEYEGSIFSKNIPSIYVSDITEIEGFDNLHNPSSIIKELEEGYRDFYRAKFTKMSVNGSTACILSSISAVSHLSKKILVGRQSHKSIYNALYINDMQPYYVYPDIDNNSGIGLEYNYEQIEEILKVNRDIRSMIFTSPTYEGVILDVKRLADIGRRYGVILIIDEAHGSHLYFDEGVGALANGADIVIQSLHKTMPTLTSTALLHANTNLNDDIIEDLKSYMCMYQTTSPSYILMGSMSICLEALQNGKLKELNDIAKDRLKIVRDKLKKAKKLKLFYTERYDDWKIVIDTSGVEEEVADIIKNFGYELEMSTDRYFIAMISLMDDFDMVDVFVKMLLAVDRAATDKKMPDYTFKYNKINADVSFNMVKNSKKSLVKIDDALNKISAECIYLYPPGVPLIAFGEVIDEEAYKIIKYYMDQGLIESKEVKILKVD